MKLANVLICIVAALSSNPAFAINPSGAVARPAPGTSTSAPANKPKPTRNAAPGAPRPPAPLVPGVLVGSKPGDATTEGTAISTPATGNVVDIGVARQQRDAKAAQQSGTPEVGASQTITTSGQSVGQCAPNGTSPSLPRDHNVTLMGLSEEIPTGISCATSNGFIEGSEAIKNLHVVQKAALEKFNNIEAEEIAARRVTDSTFTFANLTRAQAQSVLNAMASAFNAKTQRQLNQKACSCALGSSTPVCGLAAN